MADQLQGSSPLTAQRGTDPPKQTATPSILTKLSEKKVFLFLGLLSLLTLSIVFFILQDTVRDKITTSKKDTIANGTVENPIGSEEVSPDSDTVCPEGTVLTKISDSEPGEDWHCVSPLEQYPETGEQPPETGEQQQEELDETIEVSSILECDCSDRYEPVCGTDYYIYQNLCDLSCENKTLAYEGECRVYDKAALPAGCQECDATCEEREAFYEDKDGCPFCECRSVINYW